MSEFTYLGEFYFSQLLSLPVFDASGKKVGQVRDMVVTWDSVSPKVAGIKIVRHSQDVVPVSSIDQIDSKGLHLNSAFPSGNVIPLSADQLYISRWLLDKQIIDLSGSKLVRVNDITLSWVEHDGEKQLILRAVDIGVRGLFRRLGLESFATRWENKFVGWQYIKPLENRTSSLQLNLNEKLSQLHPADIADILEQIDYKHRADIMETLGNRRVIEALSEVDLDTQVEIIGQMDAERASDILEEMPPDEAADILGEMPEEKSQGLLQLMASDDAAEVRDLMQYEDDTAGALMTTEFVSLSSHLSAEQAIGRIRELAPRAETVYYVYVTDEIDRLLGVLSLRELIVAAPDTPLANIMHTNIVSVQPDEDHDSIADIFNKYGLLALPVTDAQNQILGIITVDDVLEILLPEKSKSDPYSWFSFARRVATGRKR